MRIGANRKIRGLVDREIAVPRPMTIGADNVFDLLEGILLEDKGMEGRPIVKAFGNDEFCGIVGFCVVVGNRHSCKRQQEEKGRHDPAGEEAHPSW